MKRIEDILRDIQLLSQGQYLKYRCPRVRRKKRKALRNIFEEIIVENFPNMGKEIVHQVQESQSPLEDKPKEKHIKTHINQANRD